MSEQKFLLWRHVQSCPQLLLNDFSNSIHKLLAMPEIGREKMRINESLCNQPINLYSQGKKISCPPSFHVSLRLSSGHFSFPSRVPVIFI